MNQQQQQQQQQQSPQQPLFLGSIAWFSSSMDIDPTLLELYTTNGGIVIIEADAPQIDWYFSIDPNASDTKELQIANQIVIHGRYIKESIAANRLLPTAGFVLDNPFIPTGTVRQYMVNAQQQPNNIPIAPPASITDPNQPQSQQQSQSQPQPQQSIEQVAEHYAHPRKYQESPRAKQLKRQAAATLAIVERASHDNNTAIIESQSQPQPQSHPADQFDRHPVSTRPAVSLTNLMPYNHPASAAQIPLVTKQTAAGPNLDQNTAVDSNKRARTDTATASVGDDSRLRWTGVGSTVLPSSVSVSASINSNLSNRPRPGLPGSKISREQFLAQRASNTAAVTTVLIAETTTTAAVRTVAPVSTGRRGVSVR